jgi:hypothetical protein
MESGLRHRFALTMHRHLAHGINLRNEARFSELDMRTRPWVPQSSLRPKQASAALTLRGHSLDAAVAAMRAKGAANEKT